MHNLILDNIKLKINNDINELRKKKKNFLDLYQNDDNKNLFLKEKNNFRKIDKQFISMNKFHNSKFHPKKEEDIENSNKNFSNNHYNSLTKEISCNNKKYNFNIESSSLNKNSYKNLSEFRKKIAFSYRFLNNSFKNKKINKGFKIQKNRINKLLQISRSIPNILSDENRLMKKGNNINNNYNRHKILFKNTKKYKFIIYDYYRINNNLGTNNFIFSEKKNYNHNNQIYKKINKKIDYEKNSFTSIKNDNNNNIKTININSLNKENNKSHMINLSSLLI